MSRLLLIHLKNIYLETGPVSLSVVSLASLFLKLLKYYYYTTKVKNNVIEITSTAP